MIDTVDNEVAPHIWILGDVLKPLGELFDSIEVSPDPNMLHASNRSNVLDMTNLIRWYRFDLLIADDEVRRLTTSMTVAFLLSQLLMT